jgi:hypothetical protein
MGKYVHVVAKREVYGSAEGFNWKQEEFKDLLFSLNCPVQEEDFEGYCDRWECLKANFEGAIETLKAYANGEEISEECGKDEIESSLYSLGAEYVVDPSPVIKLMETFLEQCDKNCDYVIFVAW